MPVRSPAKACARKTLRLALHFRVHGTRKTGGILKAATTKSGAALSQSRVFRKPRLGKRDRARDRRVPIHVGRIEQNRVIRLP
jgi:hypothetical protein